MLLGITQAETIGVEVLDSRFKKYIQFLEEHEVVEDQMLFPLVKALFPQVGCTREPSPTRLIVFNLIVSSAH